MKKNAIWTILAWALLISCEPCADCGNPLLYEPIVKLKFINRDSLISVRDTLGVANDSILTIKTSKDSLNAKVKGWNSSLNALRDSIENGKTQYVQDTVKIDDSLSIALNQITLLDTALVKINEIKSFFDEILDIIESGLVQVDKILILENGNFLTYTDSSTIYALPLLMQGFDFTSYSIELNGRKDTINFSFTTNLTVDAERRVEMRAFNIDTVSYTYDSLLFECNTSECLSNEVLVTVYF